MWCTRRTWHAYKHLILARCACLKYLVWDSWYWPVYIRNSEATFQEKLCSKHESVPTIRLVYIDVAVLRDRAGLARVYTNTHSYNSYIGVLK